MKTFEFEEISNEYRGLDLWMVNDELSCEEIKRQVIEFKDKGIYSVVLRTYDGIISDYLGKSFKEIMIRNETFIINFT